MKDKAEAETLTVAVRSLCEFAARSGSLEYRYTPSPSAEEGIRGHQTLQARRGAGYQAEYLLQGQCCGIKLRGRADGYQPGTALTLPLLEEIKTHRGDLSRIGPGQQALHWAQLEVYAALLCQRDRLARVQLQLVYYDVARDKETPLCREYDAESLELRLQQLCNRYREWHQQELEHRRLRDHQLKTLTFPFAGFRPHQRTLSETVYKAICTGTPLLLEAPTGIGKTLGVIYPALLAMPQRGRHSGLDRLFLLSARTPGRQLMLDALAQLFPAEQTHPVRILELTAKEKSCEHPDKACHGDSCPLADGFFDRLPAARRDAVKQGWLDREQLQQQAKAHQICPYYLAQEMARWCDLVVADLNLYFDQQALLYGLTRQNNWQVVPLVDEAHNLIDRARSMYSTSLSQARSRQLARQAPAALKNSFKALQRAWGKLHSTYADGTGADQLAQVPHQLNTALQRLISDLTDYMSEHPPRPELQEQLFDALAFLRLAEQFADHSLCRLTLEKQGRIKNARLEIQNLIPADFLAPRFTQAQSAVLFSATLSPARYYQDLLGMPQQTVPVCIDSPFAAHQLQLRTVAVSTRLKDRPASVPLLVQRIRDQYRAKPGNYLVYLPSFAYLQLLQAGLEAQAEEIPLLVQSGTMDEAERLAFIGRFRQERGLVGLAVLGGAFSEGIDLPGEALVGVFIATLGLPPFDDDHQQLAQRLQQRFGDGYAYTYLYPGLRKVIQAAGRLIRTPQDTGVIELLDERFTRPDVQQLLPHWWS